ncbi:Drug Exporter-1 [Helicobacter ailurogastricus]|uniref:Membrane-fusion protein n=2 Tax=Helicobacter ailurogastricus TaxID=1578720 RepID=A0A0K2XHC2_9HELI|nr:Membrane-fusion protein [Helicobacter ailurogastricus]CRF42938.1 Membrane-fusion protein [Helicobacter ailurogastricus]CRF45008.1 Membrane-fusion protein [Helicobacter ailurogastricus]CRF52325.1 Predicted membrane fusion protein (MFP) component of efflux pump, membrane anchor protein YbhG [Helicobacter ailurogastricus]BDQ29451.1 36 kDa antigen [Helicobacter ailurogastricus]
MKTTKTPMILAALAAVGILIWLGQIYYTTYNHKEQRLQGFIEAREYSVSSKLAGRVEKVLVKKGDFIKKGDLVFTIDSPEAEAKLLQASSSHKAAKALSNEVLRGSRSQTIKSAQDVYQAAKAQSDLAEETYKRIQSLYDKGVASLQKRDEAYAAFQSATFRKNAAYEQYQLALEGASNESKIAAKEKEQAALGQLNEVQAFLQDKKAYSPIDGEVSNVLLYSGELSPKGFPVVLVTDTAHAWLNLSVPEKYLSRFKKETIFKGYVPALKESLEFKVTHVAVMGDFATWKSTNSSQSYDMKSFGIEATPLKDMQALRMGMSVLVDIPKD